MPKTSTARRATATPATSARRWLVLALALTVCAVLRTTVATTPTAAADAPVASSPPPSRPLVVLWGDSLAWEAQDTFTRAVERWTSAEARARTFGGTALCDWLDEMEETVAREPVRVAVLEFSGNALTPCMQDPVTGAPLAGRRLVEAYARDLDRALATLGSGTHVYLVGAPAARGESPADAGAVLRDVYRRVAAARSDVTYLAAGDAVLDAGRWAATLPCLPGEGAHGGCQDGRTAVRAADGVHFCPTTARSSAGVVERCPTWSSGAFRFGTAMAEPVVDDLLRAGMGRDPTALTR